MPVMDAGASAVGAGVPAVGAGEGLPCGVYSWGIGDIGAQGTCPSRGV